MFPLMFLLSNGLWAFFKELDAGGHQGIDTFIHSRIIGEGSYRSGDVGEQRFVLVDIYLPGENWFISLNWE